MKYITPDTRNQLTTAVRQPVGFYLASLVLYLLLSGCGFHLRGASSIALPPELSSLRIAMNGAGYPPLLVEVRSSLLALGGVKLTDDVSASVPVLQLHKESSASQVLAIDSNGRISAYLINYRVDYSLIGADNKPLLRNQSVKLQREYGFDRLNVIATEKQSEYLQKEIRHDAAQQIVRRLASVKFPSVQENSANQR
jgi:LPS-assembly lipoprotein